jgi:hypothetical protein
MSSGPDAALGTTRGSGSAYGTDAKTAIDLVGLTPNESPEMLPPYRFWTYDQMRKEDAAVKSAKQVAPLPLISRRQFPRGQPGPKQFIGRGCCRSYLQFSLRFLRPSASYVGGGDKIVRSRRLKKRL